MDNFWIKDSNSNSNPNSNLKTESNSSAADLRFDELNEDISCDVCIIGAGLAGLTAAYVLVKNGYDVAVIDAGKIGSGNSARSSAIISFAHDLVYDRLIKFHGLKTAKEYYDLNSAAILKIADIVKTEGIDCGFEFKDIKITAHSQKELKSIKKESRAYEKIKAQGVAYIQAGENAQNGTGGGQSGNAGKEKNDYLLIKNQAVLNPYKYITGLAQAVGNSGAKIFENSRVTRKPKDGTLKVNSFSVSAKHFIVATHFPYIRFPGLYFAKLYQHRSHNVVFDYQHGDYVTLPADVGGEYRQAGDGRTLCCSAHVRTGRYHHESCYQKVVQTIKDDYGQSIKPVSQFSAQDCITFSLLPLVKKYSVFVKDTYVISGFNKWGFTTSVISAEHVKNLIAYKKVKSKVFCSKSAAGMLFGAANLCALIKEFSGYIFYKGKKVKDIQSGQGAIVRSKGRRLAVYRADDGKLHVYKATCPHMGCPLHYNKDEKSFDCACHGSRFDAQTGVVLDNPSLKNLKQIEFKE